MKMLSHQAMMATITRFGYAPRTVFRWIASGHLKRTRKGNGWTYKASDVNKALEHPPKRGPHAKA